MKSFLTLVVGFGPLWTQGSLKLKDSIKVQNVGERVWIATDLEYFHSNVLIAGFKDGTVLIASSPFERVGTKLLMNWVRRSLEPKKIIAINTHFHRDGTGGNHTYHKMGVETWSSVLTKNLLEKEINKEPSLEHIAREDLRSRLRDSIQVFAKNLYELKKGKVFDFSGEKAHVYFPGHAHSPDNVVVYIPDRKVLFGGCMIKPRSLGYLKAANIQNWPSAAQKLKRFGATLVVPGHGNWGGPELIDKTIEVAKKSAQP